MPQPLTDPCPKTDIAPTEGNPERYYCNADTSDFTSVVKESITLKTQIASGKFGEVWKGYLNTSNEEIVVKVQSEEMNSRKYLLEEARAISDVSHKHVISLLGVTTDGACMVVLEFCYNKDLLDYLLRNDVYEISNAERLRFVQEIASALQHISNSGYVHRNVKASNVLLTSNSTCKLSGFGFAKKLGSNGVYVGTNIDKPFGPKAIRWMALEAAEYEQFSASSDVWALGCLFHEIFTDGEAPFSGILTPNILSKLKAGYRSPKPPTIPVEIYNLMLECWNPHPMERPPLDLIQVLINEKRTQKEISYLVPNEPAPVPKIESPTKKTSSTKKIDRKMTYIKMKSILVKK